MLDNQVERNLAALEANAMVIDCYDREDKWERETTCWLKGCFNAMNVNW
jgi:hypothetical protein